MAAADQTHRQAQSRLQSVIGLAAFGLLARITPERSRDIRAGYAASMSRLVAGGQRAAAQLAVAFMRAYLPPVDLVDLEGALAGRLLTPENPKAFVGLLRFWHLQDTGVEETVARAMAGMYARNLAEGDLQAAQRIGLDAAASATHQEVRWRKVAGPNACEWCQRIAGGPTPARYFEASTVPFHTVGPCRCGVAPELVGVRWTRRGYVVPRNVPQ